MEDSEHDDSISDSEVEVAQEEPANSGLEVAMAYMFDESETVDLGWSFNTRLSGSTISSVLSQQFEVIDDEDLRRDYIEKRDECAAQFDLWSTQEQNNLIQHLLSRMCHYQQSQVSEFLKPMLQRDFLTVLSERGLVHIAEHILSYLDEEGLIAAEYVSVSWKRVVDEGMLWKHLIERMVQTDSLWKGISEQRGWGAYLFAGHPDSYRSHAYFRDLWPDVITDIEKVNRNWSNGEYGLQKIECRSEGSKGVYCLQYDKEKIVSGLRDNSIKIWNRQDLENVKVLTGHTGSVLCLQFNDDVIITGSSDSTVRVWDVHTGENISVLTHHQEAVLHLRFDDGIMITCSKDRSIAVWDMESPTQINIKKVLVGHRAAVNVIDFDSKFIVSASGDRTIKIWNTATCEFYRTLTGHRRGIACLQYKDKLIVSGSSDNTIRLWRVQTGICLRVLPGHQELVRCIRFDNKRIISGAYDGKIIIWDLQDALNRNIPVEDIRQRTLSQHTGRVFRLQFDEFYIISSSHDDTILIWDFWNMPDEYYPPLHSSDSQSISSS